MKKLINFITKFIRVGWVTSCGTFFAFEIQYNTYYLIDIWIIFMNRGICLLIWRSKDND